MRLLLGSSLRCLGSGWGEGIADLLGVLRDPGEGPRLGLRWLSAYIDGERVTSYELHEPFNVIDEAYTIYRQHQAEPQSERDSDHGQQPGTYYRSSSPAGFISNLATTMSQPELPPRLNNPQTASSAGLLTETGVTSRDTLTRSLALALAGHGSSRRVMVGVAGFEPTASSSRSNPGGPALIWAKPNRGSLFFTCANALSGSR
jgi:hypothetical protein